MSRASIPRCDAFILALGVLLLSPPSPAHGQAARVELDRTVRLAIRGQPDPVVGRVVSVDSASWTLETDAGTRTVELSSVEAAMVRRTRRNTVGGALIGAGTGVVVGAVARASLDECEGLANLGCQSVKTPTLVIAVLGGTLVGAGVGTLIVSERWTPVPIVTVSGPGGPGLGVGFRLPLGR